MEYYTDFRECYQCWANWIGFDKERIHKNTIWHQCTEMMNNEFMFQALMHAGKKAANHPDYRTFLSSNPVLIRYIQDGYFGFQYLAIRRLTESYSSEQDKKNVKGVVSLNRLLDNMKEKSSMITREAFVCFDGLPYHYQVLLAQEREEQLLKLKARDEAVWLDDSGAGNKSAKRHLMFDRLSLVSELDRKPNDIISQAYWQECQNLLDDPNLLHIKNFVNKYLAHAADEASQNTLEDEDKRLSMERIHNAQRSLIKLIQKLTLDFYDRQYAMVPVFDVGEILNNFSKPFVSDSILSEVFQELQVMMQKQYSTL